MQRVVVSTIEIYFNTNGKPVAVNVANHASDTSEVNRVKNVTVK